MNNFTALTDVVTEKMNSHREAMDYDYAFKRDILTIVFHAPYNNKNVYKTFIWENASGRMAEIVEDVAKYLDGDDAAADLENCRRGKCRETGQTTHVNYCELSGHVFATSIDAIEAFRAEKGDMFATAAEMEMLRDDPDYRRQVLGGVKVAEYIAEAKADADRLAAELAELNANAAIPEGFELVEHGTIKAGFISWDKIDGEFVTYNFDVPEIMVSQCFLVGRPIVVHTTGGGPNGVNAMATGPARVVRELTATPDDHVEQFEYNEKQRELTELENAAGSDQKVSDIRPGQRLIVVDGSDNPPVYNGRAFDIETAVTDGESADMFARFNSNGKTIDVAHYPGDPADLWRPAGAPNPIADDDADDAFCSLCMLDNFAHRSNCENGYDR